MKKHNSYDLAQMQALPLEIKIGMTKQRIQQWYDHYNGDVYVSFSGGKDSTVLKHIVDSMYDDVPSVFVNTGLEFPEIQRFAMSQPNVVTVRPKMNFNEVLKKYGYPVISKENALKLHQVQNPTEKNKATMKLRLQGIKRDGSKSERWKIPDKWMYLKDAPFDISDRCCDVMKKRPLNEYAKKTGRHPIIATMAAESLARKSIWMQYGCNAFEAGHPQSRPMSFWTEQDVLHYLKKYDVPYCSVYGDILLKESTEKVSGQLDMLDVLGCEDDGILETTGEHRTGCIFCMFGCHLEKEPNRFQKLKETHPKQYAYCINGGHTEDGKWRPDENGLGLGYVLDYIGVKYD